jgi:phosphatidyl-myo-inositol dimannoside synthase
MRLLVLIPDGYGGRGGIAKFNRDLLSTLAAHADVDAVVALPRVIVDPPGDIPESVRYVEEAAGGTAAFLRALVSEGLAGDRFDAVICGHINLLPLARLAAARWKARLLLIAHGIEAWSPLRGGLAGALSRRAASGVDVVVTVSDVTRKRMTGWLSFPRATFATIPNCFEPRRFAPGPKNPALLERYGLEGRTILLTMARMAASERYKGFDEVLDALPRLADNHPGIAYLICGDGDDRPRLEAKARQQGLADRVVFAGYIPEEEKVDHYRLADAFVMPGRGEGFGIVYLEALACGVPVVASGADASREAVRDGRLGEVVDPDNLDSVAAGIERALERGHGVPEGLDYFSFQRYQARWHGVIRSLAPAGTAAGTQPASL